MVYELIIIGAGAAGLFAGASLPRPVNGLILEKKAAPGRKLLMSGSGQCNLTHGGSIKDFISHYGENGSLIRPILYQYNNLAVMDFFERRGVPLFQREDEKIFPRSLKAQDVLDALTEGCRSNGLRFRYSTSAERITYANSVYTVFCGGHSYETAKLIVASGGCSYPGTGSDGSIFPVLEKLGIEIVPPSPALVPVYVKDYPYQSLAGISFPQARVTVSPGGLQRRDALLLTHACFSGPAILNLARSVRTGDQVTICYAPSKSEEDTLKALSLTMSGNKKQLLTALYEALLDDGESASPQLPKRFLEILCRRAGADPGQRASSASFSHLKAIVRLLLRDEFMVLKKGGFETAMATAGGVALPEIAAKTMESKKYPGLFFAGEVLDADGDTGGYNLQFAFSSGRLAAMSAASR